MMKVGNTRAYMTIPNHPSLFLETLLEAASALDKPLPVPCPLTTLAVWPFVGSHLSTTDSVTLGQNTKPREAYGSQQDPKAKKKTNLPKIQWKFFQTQKLGQCSE